MLAYYRNGLVHIFLNEAYICCALESFGESIGEIQGFSLQRLWEQTSFLSNLLREEFVVKNQIKTFEDF